jgi:diguanylate cyclase (GGDEF)-like protein/PAS domain S-box-containing protein
MRSSAKAPAAPATSTEAVDYPSLVVDSADMSTVSGMDGRYLYVSPASSRLFGWDPAALEGHHEDEFVHPHDLPLLHADRAALTRSEFISTNFRFLCRDGTTRWTETTSRRIQLPGAQLPGAQLIVSVMRDITDRQLRAINLEHQALTDPLTGLANRTVLMDRLNQALRRLDRSDGVLSVLYLDLDRFKIVNDSLGHNVGDAVLAQMAQRLIHHLRPADTLARLGGDEFVIVAEGLADEHGAVELGNRVIDAGRIPFNLGEEEFVCTVSVGISCTRDSQRAAGDLLGEADLALYRAKDQGRDRAEVFGEELRTKAVGRLATERMLRRALTDRSLVVEYQPIIDLRSEQVVAAEALIRIKDPDNGLLAPQSFLEVAEETGLLIKMDEQVLADAVRQVSAWHARLPETSFAEVAINVTARHLADTGFQRSIIGHLDYYGVPHHNLQVEVTERVLLEASNSAMTGLRALRDAGVQVGLDDFGTGYSSLSYLRQFPLDFVKIDRSFICDLERATDQRAIVAAIIDLSHALNLNVIAEGIETEVQLGILEGLECDRGQGFLFATSVSPDAVDELVTSRQGSVFSP